MDSQVFYTTIKLIKSNEVVYSIEIKYIDSYEFYFDSKFLANLSITVSHLDMDDLNMLINEPYDCYVLMAKKKIIKNNEEYFFNIPAKAYKRMNLVDDGQKIKLFFTEREE